MEKIQAKLLTLMLVFGLGFYSSSLFQTLNKAEANFQDLNDGQRQEEIKLGAFSISLSVKNLEISKAFYENLGFSVLGGGMDQNYLIMKNENSLIGLFQGMFEGNILTFNPGWDENGKNIADFLDIREIQKHLKNKNITLTSEADENSSGPASLLLRDPDNNLILIDQHR